MFTRGNGYSNVRSNRVYANLVPVTSGLIRCTRRLLNWLMEGLPVARTQSPGCPGDVNRRQFPFMPTKPRAVFNPMSNCVR